MIPTIGKDHWEYGDVAGSWLSLPQTHTEHKLILDATQENVDVNGDHYTESHNSKLVSCSIIPKAL